MHSPKELLYDWMGANEWLFLHINSLRGEAYDDAMLFLTHIADHHYFPYYLGALAVLVLLICLVRLIRRQPVRAYFVQWIGVFAVLAVGYGANGLVVGELKNYFAYPRPYLVYNTSQARVLERNTENQADDHHSFPSGHAAFATLMVVGLWPQLSSRMRWLGVLLILGVCWSRVAVGMHFPADTLASVSIVAPLIMIVRGVTYKVLLKIFKLRC